MTDLSKVQDLVTQSLARALSYSGGQRELNDALYDLAEDQGRPVVAPLLEGSVEVVGPNVVELELRDGSEVVTVRLTVEVVR